jgi:hypothetical protein
MVLPNAHGGRLDVPSERTRSAARFVADFEFEDGFILLEAMHQPKKRKQPAQVHGFLDIVPKV